MLSQRTITGVLQDANGTLLANTVFYFIPVGGFGSGGVVIPPQPEAVTTNGSGVFSVDLNTMDEGTVKYQCTIGQWSFQFDLTAGEPISLDDLLNNIIPPPPDTTDPTVPTMSAATEVEETQIRWNWLAATDDTAVVGYDIEIAEDSAFTVNVRGVSLGNVLTYLDTGLDTLVGYYARVRARDEAGNVSAYSSYVGALTGLPPTGLTLTVLSDSEILAEWDAPPDVTAPSVPVMTAATGITETEISWNWLASTDDTAVTGYDLQVAEDAGFSVGLVTHNLGNVLTYQSTGLVGSTQYYARARAHDAVPNNSAYSSSVNATTDAPPAWAPSDLPDILHWYKATSLALADNDPVSTWVDDAGTQDLTSTGSARPTYKANAGDPYVEFDGTDDVLASAVSETGSPADMAIVMIVDVLSSSDYERLLDRSSITVHVFTAGNVQFADLGAGPAEPMPPRPTGFMALYAERDGASGKIRLDGSETTGVIGTNAPQLSFKVGEEITSGYNGNFRVKEIIMCDNNLSGGDFTLLAAYIFAEYGLTL